MIGAIMFFSILVLAVFADQIAPYEYDAGNPAAKLMEPCKEHLFGTDEMGRDLFSRIVYGARITLKVAIIGGSIQLVLGVVVGLFCGYFGGVVDKAMLFLADLTWCVPGMVMALAVVTVIGTNLTNAIIAIALVNWASMARTVRFVFNVPLYLAQYRSRVDCHGIHGAPEHDYVHNDALVSRRRFSAAFSGLGPNGIRWHPIYHQGAVACDLSRICACLHSFEFYHSWRGPARLAGSPNEIAGLTRLTRYCL